MNSAPDSQGTPQGGGKKYNVPMRLATPIPQPAFVVTNRQWGRIRQSVKGISASESQWLSAAYALLSAAIAFGIGAVSLWYLEDASSWIFTLFCVLAGAGFASAILCAAGYRGNRGQRLRDINSVIEFMNDVEANYSNERA